MVSRIQQSLSFHDSPESFISSRLEQLSLQDPNALPGPENARKIVRASILNRNVHIISSYEACRAILNGDVSSTTSEDGATEPSIGDQPFRISTTGNLADDEPTFAAGPAYAQFMAAFFPGPNVLLQDGPEHKLKKQKWTRQMRHLVHSEKGMQTEILIQNLTTARFIQPILSTASQSRTIDLYDVLKSFSWDILFGVFLNLDRQKDISDFSKLEVLQEDLLRGQFSLFPVSISTPFWKSPRSKGLSAVSTLQDMLKKKAVELRRRPGGNGFGNAGSCPAMSRVLGGDAGDAHDSIFSEDATVAHLLVFTSSIANKGLASLLTAFMLNVFLWQDGSSDSTSLAELIRSQDSPTTKDKMLSSILAETERLSPPVVGVMRRVKRDIVLHTDKAAAEEGTDDYAIPSRHDAWLYLAGANRDPDTFEDTADIFVWDRYMSDSDDEKVPAGLAFGGGVKQCLGMDLARKICLTVAKTVLESQLSLKGTVAELGVRHWLGWEKNVPLDVIARDLKQLPCQRPRRPVIVGVTVDA